MSQNDNSNQARTFQDLSPEDQAKDDAYNDEINEETFGFMRDLSGEEREKAIAECEENLTWAYREGLYECKLENDYENDGNMFPADGGSEIYKKDVARLRQVYAASLAAIHVVPKDHVIVNADGTFTLTELDGTTVNYDENLARL